jgi:hypothetical protein
MSSGNAAWACQKGRMQKESNQSARAARKFNKEGSYANTHLFTELNRIVVPFTQQQKNLQNQQALVRFQSLFMSSISTGSSPCGCCQRSAAWQGPSPRVAAKGS